jgi:hypothetical protein
MQKGTAHQMLQLSTRLVAGGIHIVILSASVVLKVLSVCVAGPLVSL